MLNKIQSQNINQQPQIYDSDILATQDFCPNISNDADVFEMQSGNDEKSKNKLQLALLGVTGAITTLAAVAHHKLGVIIKTVGEKIPSTPWARLEKVFELTSKDGMTGLFNKQALLTRLSQEYGQAVAKGETFNVAMLDMDNFKGINEVFSHDIGDVILKRIALNIQKVANKYDAKGFRYGGEEFVVTIPKKDAETSKKIIEEIADEIKKDKIIQDYLPKFTEHAQDNINYINEKFNLFNSIFPQIRKGQKVENPEQLRDNIISLIEAHIKKFEPSECEIFDEIICKLKMTKSDELPKVLQGEIKFDENSTLGEELNKIYSQYKGLQNDLKKWINHTNRYNMFTVSGGVISLNSSTVVNNSEDLIRIADAALKSAKENGKNTVVLANEKIIRKIIDKPGA